MRDIPGFFGKYAITCDGRVWSRISGHWLKSSVHPLGYPHINLLKKTWRIHRLVAMTWLPNPKGLRYVNHRDGNKANNSVANLEWCSKSHDLQHAWDTELRQSTDALRSAASRTGKRLAQAWAKLDEHKAVEIRRLSILGESGRQLANRYGVSRSSIRDVLSGRSYREVGE